MLQARRDILQNFNRVVSVRVLACMAIQPGSDGHDQKDEGISQDTDKEEETCWKSCQRQLKFVVRVEQHTSARPSLGCPGS